MIDAQADGKEEMIPVDESHPSGVPEPLRMYLSKPQRIAHRRLSLPWIEYRLLARLAVEGWSFRYALAEKEALLHGQEARSGTFNRAYATLAHRGLWEATTVWVTSRVALVRLTKLGRLVLKECGLTPVESEWDQIERKHRGDGRRQRNHTGALCVFAYHARSRGYQTHLCPRVSGPAEPDLQINQSEEHGPSSSLFVEVQGRGGTGWRRAVKWQNSYALQGQVVICGLTPEHARRYACEAQRSGVARGLLTDILTLHKQNPANLWTHTWQSKTGPLLLVQDEQEENFS